MYPPGGFHFVGQTMPFNPISPRPPSAYGTPTPEAMKQGTSVNIEIDKDDNNDANRTAKKRYWTHEEEERLVMIVLSTFCRPVFGFSTDLFIFSYFVFCRPVLGWMLLKTQLRGMIRKVIHFGMKSLLCLTRKGMGSVQGKWTNWRFTGLVWRHQSLNSMGFGLQ